MNRFAMSGRSGAAFQMYRHTHKRGPPKTAESRNSEIAEMHTALLVILGAAFALVLACVLRFLQNTLLLGRKPPIFEDIPFVGGLITFIKVRGSIVSR